MHDILRLLTDVDKSDYSIKLFVFTFEHVINVY
jgi:hypothetical protein